MKKDSQKNNKKQNRSVDKMVDQSLRELGTMRFVTLQFWLSWKSLLVVMFLAGMASTVLLVTDWFPISSGQQQARTIENTSRHQFESESGQTFGPFNSNNVSVRVISSSDAQPTPNPTGPPDTTPAPPGQCIGGSPGLGGAGFPDINSDGCVDLLDLSMVLACWGYGEGECFANMGTY